MSVKRRGTSLNERLGRERSGVDPNDWGTVLLGSRDGVLTSRDSGRTWHALANARDDAAVLAIPGSAPSTIYMAGQGVSKISLDKGRSFRDAQTDLPNIDLHGLAADPLDSSHLYCVVPKSGLFESLDAGSHWRPVATQPVGATGALAIVADGAPTSILYVATNAALLSSSDRAHTWHAVGLGLPDEPGSLTSLVAVPNNGQELYAGTGRGLYHSSDGGATWHQAALADQPLVAIAASTRGPLCIYALGAGGALFRLEAAALTRNGEMGKWDDGRRN